MSLDSQGRLYVLLQYRNKFDVARVDTDRLTRIYAYSYTEWGSTFDMAGDAQGNLAVGRIGPTEAGSVTWVPQSAQPATDTTAGLLNKPVALNNYGKMVLDGSGNVYIADMTVSASSDNKTYATGMRVIKLAPDGTVTTLLSGFPSGQNGLSRQLPTAYTTNIGLAVSASGDVYVSVPTDQAVYKISSQGAVTLYAGKPAQPGVSSG
jgi:sugar lactone lactonase YvrE